MSFILQLGHLESKKYGHSEILLVLCLAISNWLEHNCPEVFSPCSSVWVKGKT